MKYRDGEDTPELGDSVDVYNETFPPERATVATVGKNKIKVQYEDSNIKPASEWLPASDCDLISREG